MKTKLLLLSLMTSLFSMQTKGQNRTIVNAYNSEISYNLDLRAVASIFGDSNNLQDFEQRLNDPKLQISNLDLNNDNQVDYLRVIESVENKTHVIIIQSIFDRDLYQDVATIEIEKDRYNKVHIQVVGNSYMYGENFIYEPAYYSTPIIYNYFWSSNYRPYYSSWSWNYYPSYYYAWNPHPVYRYRYNINNCLNHYNHYNYVSNKSYNYTTKGHHSRSSNSYEKLHPNHYFSKRNTNESNHIEFKQKRNISDFDSTKRIGYVQNRTNQKKEYSLDINTSIARGTNNSSRNNNRRL